MSIQVAERDRSEERCPSPIPRDRALRKLYLRDVWRSVPRLLGAVDRNPFSQTYGCFDREFWHYRTAAFPSGMHQEAVLALALVFKHRLPGNRWQGQPILRELALAGIRFASRSGHKDGSCDDYYPFERAFGAAVFSLQAAARACQTLEEFPPDIVGWLTKRARWIASHSESGKLTNHHALAALGLWRVFQITRDDFFRHAARASVRQVLEWQDGEGWFNEYGGADPGYQTITIDCLAKLQRESEEFDLEEPLRRAVSFARCFLAPDGSYGGVYGSRGTRHFYPHGFELLAARDANAADLADGFLTAAANRRLAHFDDDRLYVHRLANLIEAFRDWRPRRAESSAGEQNAVHSYPNARLHVVRRGESHTVISDARGGIFTHHRASLQAVEDAGLVVQCSDGRIAVSQKQQRLGGTSRHYEWHDKSEAKGVCEPPFTITIPLHYNRFETATPFKQAALHLFMTTAGRWLRTFTRRLLQARLITGRRPAPIRLERSFEFLPDDRLRVTDRILLEDSRLTVSRLAFASDFESAYVAATGVYQRASLQPWTDLDRLVDQLNARREITVVREW